MRSGGEADRLAPVTFLPGVAPVSAPAPSAPLSADAARRAVTFSEEYWADDEPADEQSGASRDGDGIAGAAAATEAPIDRDALVANAATALTRSLARRALSIAEVRAKLRTDGLTTDEAQVVIDDFAERGWLDDSVLAEQLVHSATTRKDMGSRAVRQLLVKRLIARDVIDAAIAELPDDDAARALDVARGKARSLTRYADDTAMRRLMGMLARRGFGGSVAGHAARTALAEARAASGVTPVRLR